jgi:hypothetical protein
MALGARIRNTERINQRLGVFDRPDAVNSMTAYAGGDLLIACFEQFAMYACQVLLLLIHTKTGIESLHEIGVAVALTAKIWDFFRGGSGNKALALIHGACRIFLVWVSAMAVRAGQAPGEMYIVLRASDRI